MASTSSVRVGSRFGRLVVIATGLRIGPFAAGRCRCDCGTEKTIRLDVLVDGGARSCGCFRRERAGRLDLRHGEARRGHQSAEHMIWCGMIGRCTVRSAVGFPRYGGRGISVCARWLGPKGFEHFLVDMGRRPSPEHSIDRRDNAGNYEPGNCRWATRSEQAKNRRERSRDERGRYV